MKREFKLILDCDLWRQLAIILLLIMLNAFFAGSETAMVSLRQTRIRQLVDDGNKAAILVDRLLKDPSHFLATIQIGITLAGFLAGAAAAVTLSDNLARLLHPSR
ncbi:hypothetical protein SY88_23055 [Clostridiales bacterium PH28_bin88]|nr:hypothetical protein SY88_23055 [Clostridiales bacterium PH28_bin88]